MNTDDLFDEYLATLERGTLASHTGFADFLVARVDKLETQLGDALEMYERESEQLAALAWARWIPVSERLPEENGSYIIHWEDRYIGERATHGFFRKGEWFNSGINVTDKIISWMPLPPAPVRAEPESETEPR